MTDRPLTVPKLHPTARTIAVTSGKGGAAKSTTAAALAARMSADGLNVVVVDMDIPAPNAHIVGELAESAKLSVNLDTAEMVLPWSPLGYRIVSPTLFEKDGSPSSMAAVCGYANEIDVIIYDLPGGWTSAQTEVIDNFVDVVLAVSPPTATALSDHEAHLAHIVAAVASAKKQVTAKDKRRKIEFPETKVFSVETLTSYIGTTPDGTPYDVRQVRRRQPNHVVLTHAPRAGYAAAVRLDADDTDTQAQPDGDSMEEALAKLMAMIEALAADVKALKAEETSEVVADTAAPPPRMDTIDDILAIQSAAAAAIASGERAVGSTSAIKRANWVRAGV